MTAELRIRRGEASDVACAIELERATAEAPHWAESEYLDVVHEDALGLVRRCFIVAEREGQLLGFAIGKVLLAESASFGEIESVVVDAVARRVGVGRALCKRVSEWCREQGALEIELEVRAGSNGAIALYEGLGFNAVGRRFAYYQNPTEDALLMQLRLVDGQ